MKKDFPNERMTPENLHKARKLLLERDEEGDIVLKAGMVLGITALDLLDEIKRLRKAEEKAYRRGFKDCTKITSAGSSVR